MENQLVVDEPDPAQVGQRLRLVRGNLPAVEPRAATAIKIGQDE
jgi:hypothetical protein